MSPPNDKPKKREYIRLLLDFIFGFQNQRGEILDGWIYSAEGFSISPNEFYLSVEEKLAAEKFPHVEVSRVEFPEGGLLSGQRQYLRLMRERLSIDTCAAPFGGHFFFSCRIVYVPALIRLWHLVAAMLFFGLVGGGLVALLGFDFAVLALIALLFAIAAVFRNAGSTTFSNFDTLLLKIPVVATIYENWFRLETYYRADTRTLYRDILPGLIKTAAEQVTAEKGIKLVRRDEPPPVFTELHR